MKLEYTLNRSELDTIHSVMGEVTNRWDYTDQEVNTFWNILPTNIKLDAIKWGVSDTPTRENMYVFFIENKEDVENQILESNIIDSSIKL